MEGSDGLLGGYAALRRLVRETRAAQLYPGPRRRATSDPWRNPLGRPENVKITARAFRNTVPPVVIALALFIAVEYAYRGYIYYAFSRGDYPVTIIDGALDKTDTAPGDTATSPGLYLRDRDVRYRVFGRDRRILHQSRVRTNNLGYVSGIPYRVERRAGEYRIAVLGDSLAASVTNNVPWPDVLHRRLNADSALKQRLGIETFTVMNFGLPGAGFPDMAAIHAEFAHRFAPDLVVVNFIAGDFPRNRIIAPVSNAPGIQGRRLWRGVEAVGPARVVVICDSPGVRIAKRDCFPTYLMYMPRELVKDPRRVAEAKVALAQAYLAPRLWASSFPHLAGRVMGYPFGFGFNTATPRREFSDFLGLLRRSISTTFADRSNPVTREDEDSAREQENFSAALAAIRAIRKLNDRIVLVYNPLHPELLAARAPPENAMRLARESGLRLMSMADWLPAEAGRRSIESWFNLPHDGHFSDLGAAAYAGALHRALAREVFSKR